MSRFARIEEIEPLKAAIKLLLNAAEFRAAEAEAEAILIKIGAEGRQIIKLPEK